MNEELTNDEVEIDLVDLGYVLLDKWRYLLISLIAGAVLLGAYSFFFIAPTYESTAKLSRLRRDSGLHRRHRQNQRPFHSPPRISAVPRYG